MKKRKKLGSIGLGAGMLLIIALAFTSCPKVVDDDTPVTKEALTAKVGDAQTAVAGPVVSDDGTDVDIGTAWVTQAVKTALEAAITAAQAVLADEGASQAQVDEALSELTGALDAFNDAIQDGLKADKTTLSSAITAAGEAKEGVEINTAATNVDIGKKWVTQTELDALDSAITTAQGVYNNVAATPADVVEAVTTLNTAVGTFNQAKKDGQRGDKTTLANAITAANTAKEGVEINTAATNVDIGKKWVTQTDLDALDAAIITAQGVYNNTAATPDDVVQAVTTLNAAVSTFNQAKKDGLKADKEALGSAITAAGEAKEGVSVSINGTEVLDGTDWVTQADKDALEAAITAAQGVYEDLMASTDDVIQAVSTLSAAVNTFNTAKQNGRNAPQLHHDFNPTRYASGVFTPLVGDSATTKAEPKNSGWLSGSGTANGKTFHFYKTGDKKAMNAGATYLDLGTGTGAILNDAAQGYTMAAYIYIAGDWSGNGNFIWAFAATNNVGQSTGQGLWFSPSQANHSTTTTTGGWSGPTAISGGSNKILQNQWHHVAYTQNGKEGPDNGKVYVDGEQVAAGTIIVIPNDFNALIFNTLGGPCFTSDNNLSQTMFTDFRIYNTALDAGQIAALAGNLNDLKAVTTWTPSSFFKALTFNSNSGGDIVETPAPVYVPEGGTAASLPAPVRSGYIFDGWYTQSTGGDEFTTSTTVTAPITLYARWKAAPFTVIAYSGTTVGTSGSNLADENLATLWTTNRLNQFYHMDLSFRQEDGSLIAAGDPAGLNGYRHWITIDLGQVVNNISKLEYRPRNNTTANQRVKNCEIYVSEEVNLKINIQRAITANLAKKVGETPAAGWDTGTGTDWRPAIVFTVDGSEGGTPTPVSARYIQLRITGTTEGATGTYHAAISDIRLYTKDGENDAVLTYPAGTQAYGTSQNNDQRGMLPMTVIDGDASTNWLSGNVNVTSAFNQADFEALKANLPADPHFDVGHWITLDLGASPETYTGLKYHRRRDNVSTGNFSGVEIYASDNLINPAVDSNPGMSLVKIFTGLPIGNLNNVERWTLLDFGQSINKRYLHIRITGEIYSTNSGYGSAYNAGPDMGNEAQPTSGGQLGIMWGSAAAAEFTIVR